MCVVKSSIYANLTLSNNICNLVGILACLQAFTFNELKINIVFVQLRADYYHIAYIVTAK